MRSHKLTFKKWIELEIEYIKKSNVWYDLIIIIKNILVIGKNIVNNLT